MPPVDQVRAVRVQVRQHQRRRLVGNVENHRKHLALAEGVDEGVKILGEHAVVVVNRQRVHAVKENKVALIVHGSKRVEGAQQDAFQHDGAVDEGDVVVRHIRPTENTRGNQVEEMDVRNINTDGFEGLYDFNRTSTGRDVDAAHFEHLHQGNHGTGGHGKRVRGTQSNLNGASQGDLSELFGDHLVEFKHP